VNLISRIKQLLVEQYPGTKSGISEWNWGADTPLNYAAAPLDSIVSSPLLDQPGAITLPAYSISLLVIEAH
jgi:hypothetical protein